MAETDKKDFTAQQIKMKEIHKPSSFEGALWAAQGITDARVIYHAPPGCYLMQHMNSICNEWHPEMYSTLVSYAEVMQGTGEKLERILEQVAAEKPKAIIIITSPVIEITGDDVQGAATASGFKKTVVIRPSLGGTLAEGKEKAFISLDFSLIEKPMQERIVTEVQNTLVTLFGLRTLSPKDSRYKGTYLGNHNKDVAYHNGTVWPWLMGPFIKAFLKVKGYEPAQRRYAFQNFLQPMIDVYGDFWDGSVHEIFDGDPPYSPQGCITQAWSVAEILRTWVEDIENIKPKYEPRLLHEIGI